MKRIAMEGIDGRKLGVDAGHWFAMVTGKIDRLKTVEDKLAADLHDLAADLQSGAQLTLYLFIALTLIALAATAVSRLPHHPKHPAPPRRRTGLRHRHRQQDRQRRSHLQVRTQAGDTTSLLAAMKEMSDKLVAIVTDVRGGSEQIGTASKQIADGNTNLSQRTQEQARRWKRPPRRWKR